VTGDEIVRTEREPTPAPPAQPWAEVSVAGSVAVLGALMIAGAPAIGVPAGQGAVGPRFFPYLVGGLLLVVGSALVVDVLRVRARAPGHPQGPAAGGTDPSRGLDLRTVGRLVVVLVAHVGLVERAGWPVAAMVLFGGSALVLGARRPAPLLAASVVLPVVAWLVFTRGLGVALPAGPFSGLG
jgi:putative tricarboxylic transport membrane protein